MTANKKIKIGAAIILAIYCTLEAVMAWRAWHVHRGHSPVWVGPMGTTATIIGGYGDKIEMCEMDGYYFLPRGNTCYSDDKFRESPWPTVHSDAMQIRDCHQTTAGCEFDMKDRP